MKTGYEIVKAKIQSTKKNQNSNEKLEIPINIYMNQEFITYGISFEFQMFELVDYKLNNLTLKDSPNDINLYKLTMHWWMSAIWVERTQKVKDTNLN